MSNIKEVEEELKEFEFVEDNEDACGLIVKIKTQIKEIMIHYRMVHK